MGQSQALAYSPGILGWLRLQLGIAPRCGCCSWKGGSLSTQVMPSSTHFPPAKKLLTHHQHHPHPPCSLSNPFSLSLENLLQQGSPCLLPTLCVPVSSGSPRWVSCTLPNLGPISLSLAFPSAVPPPSDHSLAVSPPPHPRPLSNSIPSLFPGSPGP